MKCFVIPWVCFFSAIAQSQPSSTGVITGAVTGEDGSRISGARVGILLQSPPHGKAAQTFWSVASSADGSFAFSRLSGGAYKICVEVPNSVWLNPCEWGLGTAAVSLTASIPATGVSVVLKKGAVVPIRVDDPSHILAQNEGKTPGANLLIGAGTAISSFRTASIASQDATGRNYQLVVPYNYPATITVSSPFFKLADASGVSLASGVTAPITVSAGQTAMSLHIIVVGGGN